jgi:hypothetical protein
MPLRLLKLYQTTTETPALMQNQVDALRDLNIDVASWSSSTSKKEQAEIERDMLSGHPRNRLLYSAPLPSRLSDQGTSIHLWLCLVTPERIKLANFQRLLKKVDNNNELARFVIDEVCALPLLNTRVTHNQPGRHIVFQPGVQTLGQAIEDSDSCGNYAPRWHSLSFD